MPFLRPDGLVTVTGTTWTGAVSNINEEVPNDSTLVVAPTGTTGTLHVSMSNPGQAQFGGTTGIVRWRWARRNEEGLIGGGNSVSMQVRLLFNSANDNVNTTLFSTSTISGWATLERTFNLSSVINYDDLRLRFEQLTASGTTPATRSGCVLSWAEIELLSPRRVTIIL